VDPTATGLTLRLATSTTLILLCLGLPLAYWLATARWKGKFLVEAFVALPLVLPPTVLGFYILLATGPRGPIGKSYEAVTGGRLPFTFHGILLGSIVCNLPFAVRPFTAAMAAVDQRLLETSWCLGVSRLRTFLRVTMPLSWQGILTGMDLTFAHTVGEFGVVLMLGGNIPGVTRTLSIAIYDDVQALDYESAGRTATVLVVVAFAALCTTYVLQRRVLPSWRAA
jgi:molybdate transport system permease protein